MSADWPEPIDATEVARKTVEQLEPPHAALLTIEEIETMALAVLAAIEREQRLEAALRFICTTNDSGPYIEIYRAAGSGYEGLQAVASAALRDLDSGAGE